MHTIDADQAERTLHALGIAHAAALGDLSGLGYTIGEEVIDNPRYALHLVRTLATMLGDAYSVLAAEWHTTPSVLIQRAAARVLHDLNKGESS